MMMNNKNSTTSPLTLDQALGIAIIISVFFMYSSTFLSDYLMNDEWGYIGENLNIVGLIRYYFFSLGRGLVGIYLYLVYRFVGYDTERIQFVRFINVALISCLAYLLYKFLQARVKNSVFAFLVILFWFSLPSFQGIMGYSLLLISSSQPSIWLSLFAFYLYFFIFSKRHLSGFTEIAIIFVVLILAMQSTQTYAFFSTVPISFLALSNWEKYKTKIVSFLLTTLAVLVFSFILYKIGLNILHSSENSGYRLGELGMQALTTTPFSVILNAINPVSYWSVFYLLTFPYPLSNLPILQTSVKMTISIIVMIIWAIIIATSIYIEREKNGKKDIKKIFAKWLTVLYCFGINAVFFIADSPTTIIQHRPHIILTLTGLVVFSGGYALETIVKKATAYPKYLVSYLAFAIVVFFAFGAQSNVLRNMVNNNVSQLNFIRSELAGMESNEKVDQAIVVFANQNRCISEPCDPWFGNVIQYEFHITRPAAYRYVMATMGISPEKIKISFVPEKPVEIPSNVVFIDWNKFLLTQK